MTSSLVRIPPLPYEEFTEEQKQLTGGWHHLVFSRVLVRHEGMYGTFVPFLAQVIAKTILPPRDREIICLRMLRLCRDVYEHTHHVTIARRAGLSEQEIEAASQGEGAALTGFDRELIRATEQLQRDQRIAEPTWRVLNERYSQKQMMEVVFLAGCYVTMAMLTKTFDMELEDSAEDEERINALRTYK
jgi:4-carboxymuconolactone decarboxylase